MLEFVLGRSGTGKTEYIRNTICEKIKNGEQDIILIVPEQCSFQNEKELLKRLGAKLVRNVEILSFSRLCDYAKRKYGGTLLPLLDDSARALMMNLAIESVMDKLELYSKRALKPDLTAMMLTAVSEYKTCGIEPQQLEQLEGSVHSDGLKKKLNESALIYEAYNAILENTYLDPLDELSRLYKLLCENKLFSGRSVFIDAFNGFTAQEQKIIELILSQAGEVYISLCLDENVPLKDSNSIFYYVNRTYSRIKAAAEKLSVEVKIKSLDKVKRFKSSSVALLEELIYRRESLTCDDDGAVLAYEAEDLYDETEQLARDICKLIYEEEYRYSDITVICRDVAGYGNILSSVFAKYNIPCFLSNPERLETKPIVRFLISALKTVNTGTTTENIMTMLKTGMTDIPDYYIDELENYAYTWDLKARDWLKPFTKSVDGYNAKEKNSDTLNNLEKIRSLIISRLLKFKEALRGCGKEKAKAVFDLLTDFGADKAVKRIYTYFMDKNEAILAEEENKLWTMICQMLTMISNVLGEKEVSLLRFIDLVELVIGSQKISTIPHTIDSVTVGAADTIRPSEQRAVFVIGAVDGVFPATVTENGIFSNSEREELLSLSLPLTDSIGVLSLQEKFFAYKAVSAPSEKLFLSYTAESSGGEKTAPSSIIKETQKILPYLVMRKKDDICDSDLVWTDSTALEGYAAGCKQDSSLSLSLEKYLASKGDYKNKLYAVKRAVSNKPFEFKNPENSKKLFGEELHLSASQIEKFNNCAFQYFCTYGIKAMPREKAKFDQRQYGSIVHYVFQILLSDEYGIEKLKNMSKVEKKQLVSKIIDEYILSISGESERPLDFEKMHAVTVNNVIIVLDRLIKELSQSMFKPVDFELGIGNSEIDCYTLELPSGGCVKIRGIVDRVDIMECVNEKTGQPEKYLRVIDYKTGDKKFRLNDIMYGLNIQMLLYLSAIQKNGQNRYGEVTPAGVLYMPSSVKFEKADEAEKEHSKSLKMNGFLLDDKKVLMGIERENNGEFIAYDKYPTVTLATLEQMGRVLKRIDDDIIKMGESLHSGKIPATPIKGLYDGCEYCLYDSVCAFEEGAPCRQYLKADKAEDILKSMHEGEDKDVSEKLDS